MRSRIGESRRRGTVWIILAVLAMFASTALVGAQATTTGQQAITTAICNVFDTVKTIIFILAITLFVLGGVLYSGANLLPGSQRGEIQGYGMSLIMGGIVGLAITLAAPWVLNTIMQANPNAASALSGSGTYVIGTTTGTSVVQNICNGGTNSNSGGTNVGNIGQQILDCLNGGGIWTGSTCGAGGSGQTA